MSEVRLRGLEKTSGTSVHKKYDEIKIDRYRIQLKRIDTYLQMLFNYINDNYSEGDYIYSLRTFDCLVIFYVEYSRNLNYKIYILILNTLN